MYRSCLTATAVATAVTVTVTTKNRTTFSIQIYNPQHKFPKKLHFHLLALQ